MRFFKGLIGCLVVAVVCSQANAWGSKEHIQLTRLAIEKLLADPTTPAGLKSWLIKNTPDLGNAEQERNYFLHEHVGAARNDLKGFSFWVIQPDVRSGDHKTGVPPCNVPEQMNHFIEAVAGNGGVAPLAATFEDGYRAVEVADTMIRSWQSARRETVEYRSL